MRNTILQAKLAINTRDLQLAKKYGDHLAKAGFKLVKITPRGVYFQGPLASFEKTFQAKVQEHQFASQPVMPDCIDQKVASIYFPTKPTYFP